MDKKDKPTEFHELNKYQRRYLQEIALRFRKLPERDLIEVANRQKWQMCFDYPYPEIRRIANN